MELVWAIQQDARRVLRRQRLFRDRTDILDTYDDERLIKDFRFPRHIILDFVRRCESLGRLTLTNTALPVHIQVLTTLRFLARGTFQDDVKDIIGISQPSVCRVVDQVSRFICQWRNEFISFPTDADLPTVKQKLYNLNGIPNAIGVIDGTHIFLRSSAEELEPMFVCRKGGPSVNVQVVCDGNHKLLDVVVKWPGSTHDAYIWSSCGIRQRFEQNSPNGWLLGDSGYPCEPWLFVPYETAPTTSHRRFNATFAKSRSIVERTIGLWKSVFRRICKSGGVLQYTPEKSMQFIMATAVLHNIRRDLNLREDEEFEIEPSMFDEEQNLTNNGNQDRILRQRGQLARDEVRLGFFT